MAAVIAAILAGFLAGIVALFREHRIQERQLLVAARMIDELFYNAEAAIRVSLESNGWEPINLMPTRESFARSWETFRVDLAGHLTSAEWNDLALVLALYQTLRSTTQSSPPKDLEPLLNKILTRLSIARSRLKPYRTSRFSLWRQLQRRRKHGDWNSL